MVLGEKSGGDRNQITCSFSKSPNFLTTDAPTQVDED